MTQAPFLKAGDRVCLVAPARGVSQEVVDYCVHFWAHYGIEVLVGKSVAKFHHQFSGTIQERIEDLQWAINHPEAKAILCARGGYGSVQVVDAIDWSPLIQKPKWLVGFSDMTVLLNDAFKTTKMIQLHAPMPINYPKLESNSLEALAQVLLGKNLPKMEGKKGLTGTAQGPLQGGNLSVLYSMLGSKSFPELKGSILYIEDLDEYYYHIDRMLYGLKRAGVLAGIQGVLAGTFTDMHDNATPFGSDVHDILTHHFAPMNIPVAFDAAIGHQDDALPLIHGAEVYLEVTKNDWKLSWLNTTN